MVCEWSVFWPRFISKTIQDMATVKMEDEYELVRDQSNGAISNDHVRT